MLIVKTIVVAIGAAAGGYNHKVLVPKMLDPETEGTLDGTFKKAVTLEAFVLVGVIIVTAFLVGAAST